MQVLKQTFPLHSDLHLCRYDIAIQQKPLNLLHFPFVQYLDMKAEVPALLLAFKHNSQLKVLTLTVQHNPT